MKQTCHPERSAAESKDLAASQAIIAGSSTGFFDCVPLRFTPLRMTREEKTKMEHEP